MELLMCSYNTMCSSDKKELSDSIRQKNASGNQTTSDKDVSNVYKKKSKCQIKHQRIISR